MFYNLLMLINLENIYVRLVVIKLKINDLDFFMIMFYILVFNNYFVLLLFFVDF